MIFPLLDNRRFTSSIFVHGSCRKHLINRSKPSAERHQPRHPLSIFPVLISEGLDEPAFFYERTEEKVEVGKNGDGQLPSPVSRLPSPVSCLLSTVYCLLSTVYCYYHLHRSLLDLVHTVIGGDTEIGVLELFKDIRAVKRNDHGPFLCGLSRGDDL